MILYIINDKNILQIMWVQVLVIGKWIADPPETITMVLYLNMPYILDERYTETSWKNIRSFLSAG